LIAKPRGESRSVSSARARRWNQDRRRAFQPRTQTRCHVRFADESVCIGRRKAPTVSNVPSIISAAENHGHRGHYTPDTAFLRKTQLCRNLLQLHRESVSSASPENIKLNGDKARRGDGAKGRGARASGSNGVSDEEAALLRSHARLVSRHRQGGGGRRRQRHARGDGRAGIRQCLRHGPGRGAGGFRHADVYIEKYILQPRHIEITIIADEKGNRYTSVSVNARSSAGTRKLIEEAHRHH